MPSIVWGRHPQEAYDNPYEYEAQDQCCRAHTPVQSDHRNTFIHPDKLSEYCPPETLESHFSGLKRWFQASDKNKMPFWHSPNPYRHPFDEKNEPLRQELLIFWISFFIVQIHNVVRPNSRRQRFLHLLRPVGRADGCRGLHAAWRGSQHL